MSLKNQYEIQTVSGDVLILDPSTGTLRAKDRVFSAGRLVLDGDGRDENPTQFFAPHGRIHITTPAATTVAVAATYYDIAGTTELTSSLYNFDMPSNGRLRYIGTETIHAHIAVSVSFTTGANNQTVLLSVAKNSVPDLSSQQRRKVGTGADVGSTALHADFMLATNDYITVQVGLEASTGSVTVTDFYLFALGMRMAT